MISVDSYEEGSHIDAAEKTKEEKIQSIQYNTNIYKWQMIDIFHLCCCDLYKSW